MKPASLGSIPHKVAFLCTASVHSDVKRLSDDSAQSYSSVTCKNAGLIMSRKDFKAMKIV